MAAERPFVTGLVLAAGGSRRLGQAKQLLPYGDATLLDHVLATARACPFDQRICALGGASAEVRRRAGLDGFAVVVNEQYGSGCSSSIAAALGAVDERAGVLVLLLGDQPGVTAGTVAALHGDKAVWKLLDRAGDAVCEVAVDGPVPRDVDTWADYEAVLREVVA